MDIDSKIPNLALKKIEKYHLDRNDKVIWNNELFQSWADKTYISIIFDWNKDKAKQFPNAEIGGSGYSLTKRLPSEIEKVKPRINIGFTTRGCIRNCQFCIVPKKEGKIRIEGDIYDIWDGKSPEIELLDNNIMGLSRHFEKIWGQIKKEKLKLRENGLDIRLLNKDNVKILSSIKHYDYHFAFDNLSDEKNVKKGIKLLVENGIKKSCFYVIVGFNTTFEEDLYRLNIIRNLNQNAYLQRFYYKKNKDIRHTALARWVNQFHIFRGMTWEQFINRPENKSYKDMFL
jgi:radical SAM superfamily enzyme YgiQ (UPF0313 family)